MKKRDERREEREQKMEEREEGRSRKKKSKERKERRVNRGKNYHCRPNLLKEKERSVRRKSLHLVQKPRQVKDPPLVRNDLMRNISDKRV